MQFPWKAFSLGQTLPGVGSLMRPEELSLPSLKARDSQGWRDPLPTMLQGALGVLWNLLRLSRKGVGTTPVLFPPQPKGPLLWSAGCTHGAGIKGAVYPEL